MALCEQCGSIRVIQQPLTMLDYVVVAFTGRRPFCCQRCGWRARRAWTKQDLKDPAEYGLGGGEIDPELQSLDDPGRLLRQRGASNKSKRSEERESFALDLEESQRVATVGEPSPSLYSSDRSFNQSVNRRRRRSSRRGRSGRREIVASIAITSLVTALGLILALTGSCTGFSEVR